MNLEHTADPSADHPQPIYSTDQTSDADAARQRRELEDILDLIRWGNDGGNNIG
jgi:hypothetical protein